MAVADPEHLQPYEESAYEIQPRISLNDLQAHLKDVLSGYFDYYERGEAAAEIAESYHQRMESIMQGLTPEQRSNIVLSKIYLSAVRSLGRLRQFLFASSWMGKSSEDAQNSKNVYLTARKQFQTDVDDYFAYFVGESDQTLQQVLQNITSDARLLVTNRQWTSTSSIEQDHIFLGGVLSERAVAQSLREHFHPGTRYGTVEEDASPTKADVVLPLDDGDFHIQVKMKWKKRTNLRVQPKKHPPRVVVPMHEIRGHLTKEEDVSLRSSIAFIALQGAA